MSWQRRPSLPAVASALTALPLDSITENDSSYLLAMDVDLANGLAFPELPVITRRYMASDRVEVSIIWRPTGCRT